MATTPPGWYDDGHGALRWWDGAQWTQHVATPDPESAAADAPTEAEIVASIEAQEGREHAAVEAQSAREDSAVEADPAAALGFGTAPAPGSYAAGSDPGAYPGGYPGPDAPAGAFTAATGPRRSKLWILWVVLGVVLLGIVIAAAVVIPLLFLGLTTGGGSQQGVAPQGGDQEAAVAAVELYDEAWQTVDCDAYVASTTEAFREESQLTDCESFQSTASEFSASVEDYTVAVTGIETEDDGQILVSTEETYDALFDDQGQPLDEPLSDTVRYEYTLVATDGGWAIDDLEN